MDDFELRQSERARRRFTIESAPGDGVEWSFGAEDATGAGMAGRAGGLGQQRPADAALTDPLRGAEGARRVEGVRRRLNEALEAWWREQALPSDALLREGLLALEAGHALDEAQRTLLARTAIARGRGVQTALKHQTDAERVAGLLREAVLDGALEAGDLMALRDQTALRDATEASAQARENGAAWPALLARELRTDRYSPNHLAAARATEAVAALESPPAPPFAEDVGLYGLRDEGATPARRGGLWAVLIVGALLALAALGVWWLRAPRFGDVVEAPAGRYVVTTYDAEALYSGGSLRSQDLAAFVIDRTEVTNRAYRRCVEAGVCTLPHSHASATRPNYFLDSAYDAYPVIEVDWEQAGAYCAWRGMRLPGAAEWEVAATFAPATGRTYRYPWGETWQPELVIGGGGFEDTAPVGSRSPQGDSPLGAADMAGNVAEWTAHVPAYDPALAMVRGGSWRNGADRLLPVTLLLIRKSDTSDGVGFRCAANGTAGEW